MKNSIQDLINEVSAHPNTGLFIMYRDKKELKMLKKLLGKTGIIYKRLPRKVNLKWR